MGECPDWALFFLLEILAVSVNRTGIPSVLLNDSNLLRAALLVVMKKLPHAVVGTNR